MEYMLMSMRVSVISNRELKLGSFITKTHSSLFNCVVVNMAHWREGAVQVIIMKLCFQI